MNEESEFQTSAPRANLILYKMKIHFQSTLMKWIRWPTRDMLQIKTFLRIK